MLDSYIILGLTIIIVGIIKTYTPFKTVRGKLLIPLLVFAVAGILNVINAFVFGGNILEALKSGLILGASAGGVYSMAKKALVKKDEIIEPLRTDPDVKVNSVLAKDVEQNTSDI